MCITFCCTFLTIVLQKITFSSCSKVPWENNEGILQKCLMDLNEHALTFYLSAVAIIISGIIYKTGMLRKIKSHFYTELLNPEDGDVHKSSGDEQEMPFEHWLFTTYTDQNKILPITHPKDVLLTSKKSSDESCCKEIHTTSNEENNFGQNDLIEYKTLMKKLFEERIKARTILINTFEKCIILNKEYPLIPWAKKYTLNQLNQQRITRRKEIRILGSNVDNKSTIEDIEMLHSDIEKKVKILKEKSGKTPKSSFICPEDDITELCKNIFKVRSG